MNLLINSFNIICIFFSLLLDHIIYFCFFFINYDDDYDDKIAIYELLNESLKQSINDLTFDISWKFIEIITQMKTFYKKNIIPYFHKITNNNFRNQLKVIKNGNEILQLKDIDAFKECSENIVYDLLLMTKYDDVNENNNKTLILENIDNYNDQNFEKKSDVSFIIFELKNNNKTYDINFKSPLNFNLQNNILKDSFFKWYIKNKYNEDLEENYEVNFMTSELYSDKLKNPFYIKFNENGISAFSTIKKNSESKEEKMKEEEKTTSELINQDENRTETSKIIKEFSTEKTPFSISEEYINNIVGDNNSHNKIKDD